LAYTDRSVNQISPLLSIAPQMENRISRVCAVGIGWGYSLNIAACLRTRARASWAARWGHWKGETLVVEGNGFTMEGCTNPR